MWSSTHNVERKSDYDGRCKRIYDQKIDAVNDKAEKDVLPEWVAEIARYLVNLRFQPRTTGERVERWLMVFGGLAAVLWCITLRTFR